MKSDTKHSIAGSEPAVASQHGPALHPVERPRFAATSGRLRGAIALLGFALSLGAMAAVNPLTDNIAFDPVQINPGGAATMTITVLNNNANPATGLVIAATSLPSGFSITGATTTCAGGTPTTSGTSFALSGAGIVPPVTNSVSGSCTITYSVTSTTPGTFTATAKSGSIAATVVDPVTSAATLVTNSDGDLSSSIVVSTPSHLGLTKGFNPATVAIGGASTLTFTVRNPNNFAVTGVKAVDHLDPQLILVGTPTFACTNSGPSGNASAVGQTVGLPVAGVTMPASSVCTVTATVQAPSTPSATIPGSIANTINPGTAASPGDISSDLGDPVQPVGAVRAALSVQYALTLDKTFNPALATVGGTPVLLTLTLTNPLQTPQTGAAITDIFPFADAGNTQPAFQVFDSNGIGNPPATDGGIVNGDSCNFATASYPAAGAASVHLTGGTVPANGSCTIYIWVQASALMDGSAGHTNPAQNIIPAAAASNPGGGASASAGAITLPAQAGLSIKPPEAGPAVNIGLNKSFSSTPTWADQGGDISVPPPSTAGGVVGYVTIELINTETFTGISDFEIRDDLTLTGTANANGLHLKVKPGLTAADITTIAWSNLQDCSFSAAGITPGPDNGPTEFDFKFNGSVLEPATPTPSGVLWTQCMISFPVVLDTSAPVLADPTLAYGTYTNYLQPYAPASAGPPAALASGVNGTVTNPLNVPPTAWNFAGSPQPTLTVIAPLTVAKSFQVGTIGPGGIARMVINLRNYSTSAITATTVQDILPTAPAQMTVASTTGPNGAGNPTFSSCDGGGASTPVVSGMTTLNFSAITLQPGTSTVPSLCTIQIDVTAPVSGTYTNTIAAGAVNNAQGVKNVSATSADLTVTPLTLGVTKQISPSVVNAGEAAAMTLVVTNNQTGSGLTLHDVSVIDTFNPGMSLSVNPAFSATCPNGDASDAVFVANPIAPGGFTVSGLIMAPGGSCTITLMVETADTRPVVNTIPIGGVTTAEGVSNAAPVSASLSALAGTIVTKGIAPAVVAVGQPATVTIRLTNTTGAAVGVTGAPIVIKDEINPASGYADGADPITPPTGAFVPPAAQWQIVPGSAALVPATGCSLSAAPIVMAGTASDSIVISGITAAASTICDVTYQVIVPATASAPLTDTYFNAIPQRNITGGPSACADPTHTHPCYTSATLTVIPAGTIRISKSLSPVGGALDGFVFTISSPTSGCDLSGLTLTQTTTASGVLTFSGLPVYTAAYTPAAPGAQCAFNVVETPKPGYVLDTVASTTPLTGLTLVDDGSNAAITAVSVVNDKVPTFSLIKNIVGRTAASDQFTLTLSGTPVAGATSTPIATTTGSSTGLQTTSQATIVGTIGTMYGGVETMAAGSTSALSAYTQMVACTNTGSTSVTGITSVATLATGVKLAAGDAIACTITNTPSARVTLIKNIAARGNAADQFSLSIGGVATATVTTTGNSTGVQTPTATAAATAAGNVTLTETMAAGSVFSLGQYTQAVACSNAGGPTDVSALTTYAQISGGFAVTGGDNITCTITNSPALAKLTINKTVSGAPAADTIARSFDFTIDCATATASPTTQRVTVNGNATSSASVLAPIGGNCTVSEAAPVAASAPANYTWGNTPIAPAVTIAADSSSSASFTNTLVPQVAGLTVVKTLSGGPVGYSGSFAIALACTDRSGAAVSGITPASPTSVSASNSVSGQVVFTDIPQGSTCTVSEGAQPVAPASYVWVTPLITQPTGPIAATGSVATVANSLAQQVGSLRVIKTVSGGPGGYSGSFPILVACSLGGTAVTPTEGNSQTVNASAATPGVATFTNIPQGSICTLSEGAPPPPPPFYDWATPNITQPFGAISAAASTATVANTLAALDPPFHLVKTVTGGPATLSGSFMFNINCGAAGIFTRTISLSNAASGNVTLSNIPIGTSCTFSEAPISANAPQGLVWGDLPPSQTRLIDGTDVNFVNTLTQATVGPDEAIKVPAVQMGMLLVLGWMLASAGIWSAARRR